MPAPLLYPHLVRLLKTLRSSHNASQESALLKTTTSTPYLRLLRTCALDEFIILSHFLVLYDICSFQRMDAFFDAIYSLYTCIFSTEHFSTNTSMGKSPFSFTTQPNPDSQPSLDSQSTPPCHSLDSSLSLGQFALDSFFSSHHFRSSSETPDRSTIYTLEGDSILDHVIHLTIKSLLPSSRPDRLDLPRGPVSDYHTCTSYYDHTFFPPDSFSPRSVEEITRSLASCHGGFTTLPSEPISLQIKQLNNYNYLNNLLREVPPARLQVRMRLSTSHAHISSFSSFSTMNNHPSEPWQSPLSSSASFASPRLTITPAPSDHLRVSVPLYLSVPPAMTASVGPASTFSQTSQPRMSSKEYLNLYLNNTITYNEKLHLYMFLILNTHSIDDIESFIQFKSISSNISPNSSTTTDNEGKLSPNISGQPRPPQIPHYLTPFSQNISTDIPTPHASSKSGIKCIRCCETLIQPSFFPKTGVSEFYPTGAALPPVSPQSRFPLRTSSSASHRSTADPISASERPTGMMVLQNNNLSTQFHTLSKRHNAEIPIQSLQCTVSGTSETFLHKNLDPLAAIVPNHNSGSHDSTCSTPPLSPSHLPICSRCLHPQSPESRDSILDVPFLEEHMSILTMFPLNLDIVAAYLHFQHIYYIDPHTPQQIVSNSSNNIPNSDSSTTSLNSLGSHHVRSSRLLPKQLSVRGDKKEVTCHGSQPYQIVGSPSPSTSQQFTTYGYITPTDSNWSRNPKFNESDLYLIISYLLRPQSFAETKSLSLTDVASHLNRFVTYIISLTWLSFDIRSKFIYLLFTTVLHTPTINKSTPLFVNLFSFIGRPHLYRHNVPKIPLLNPLHIDAFVKAQSQFIPPFRHPRPTNIHTIPQPPNDPRLEAQITPSSPYNPFTAVLAPNEPSVIHTPASSCARNALLDDSRYLMTTATVNSGSGSGSGYSIVPGSSGNKTGFEGFHHKQQLYHNPYVHTISRPISPDTSTSSITSVQPFPNSTALSPSPKLPQQGALDFTANSTVHQIDPNYSDFSSFSSKIPHIEQDFKLSLPKQSEFRLHPTLTIQPNTPSFTTLPHQVLTPNYLPINGSRQGHHLDSTTASTPPIAPLIMTPIYLPSLPSTPSGNSSAAGFISNTPSNTSIKFNKAVGQHHSLHNQSRNSSRPTTPSTQLQHSASDVSAHSSASNHSHSRGDMDYFDEPRPRSPRQSTRGQNRKQSHKSKITPMIPNMQNPNHHAQLFLDTTCISRGSGNFSAHMNSQMIQSAPSLCSEPRTKSHAKELTYTFISAYRHHQALCYKQLKGEITSLTTTYLNSPFLLPHVGSIIIPKRYITAEELRNHTDVLVQRKKNKKILTRSKKEHIRQVCDQARRINDRVSTSRDNDPLFRPTAQGEEYPVKTHDIKTKRDITVIYSKILSDIISLPRARESARVTPLKYVHVVDGNNITPNINNTSSTLLFPSHSPDCIPSSSCQKYRQNIIPSTQSQKTGNGAHFFSDPGSNGTIFTNNAPIASVPSSDHPENKPARLRPRKTFPDDGILVHNVIPPPPNLLVPRLLPLQTSRTQASGHSSISPNYDNPGYMTLTTNTAISQLPILTALTKPHNPACATPMNSQFYEHQHLCHNTPHNNILDSIHIITTPSESPYPEPSLLPYPPSANLPNSPTSSSPFYHATPLVLANEPPSHGSPNYTHTSSIITNTTSSLCYYNSPTPLTSSSGNTGITAVTPLPHEPSFVSASSFATSGTPNSQINTQSSNTPMTHHQISHHKCAINRPTETDKKSGRKPRAIAPQNINYRQCLLQKPILDDPSLTPIEFYLHIYSNTSSMQHFSTLKRDGSDETLRFQGNGDTQVSHGSQLDTYEAKKLRIFELKQHFESLPKYAYYSDNITHHVNMHEPHMTLAPVNFTPTNVINDTTPTIFTSAQDAQPLPYRLSDLSLEDLPPNNHQDSGNIPGRTRIISNLVFTQPTHGNNQIYNNTSTIEPFNPLPDTLKIPLNNSLITNITAPLNISPNSPDNCSLDPIHTMGTPLHPQPRPSSTIPNSSSESQSTSSVPHTLLLTATLSPPNITTYIKPDLSLVYPQESILPKSNIHDGSTTESNQKTYALPVHDGSTALQHISQSTLLPTRRLAPPVKADHNASLSTAHAKTPGLQATCFTTHRGMQDNHDLFGQALPPANANSHSFRSRGNDAFGLTLNVDSLIKQNLNNLNSIGLNHQNGFHMGSSNLTKKNLSQSSQFTNVHHNTPTNHITFNNSLTATRTPSNSLGPNISSGSRTPHIQIHGGDHDTFETFNTQTCFPRSAYYNPSHHSCNEYSFGSSGSDDTSPLCTENTLAIPSKDRRYRYSYKFSKDLFNSIPLIKDSIFVLAQLFDMFLFHHSPSGDESAEESGNFIALLDNIVSSLSTTHNSLEVLDILYDDIIYPRVHHYYRVQCEAKLFKLMQSRGYNITSHGIKLALNETRHKNRVEMIRTPSTSSSHNNFNQNRSWSFFDTDTTSDLIPEMRSDSLSQSSQQLQSKFSFIQSPYLNPFGQFSLKRNHLESTGALHLSSPKHDHIDGRYVTCDSDQHTLPLHYTPGDNILNHFDISSLQSSSTQNSLTSSMISMSRSIQTHSGLGVSSDPMYALMTLVLRNFNGRRDCVDYFNEIHDNLCPPIFRMLITERNDTILNLWATGFFQSLLRVTAEPVNYAHILQLHQAYRYEQTDSTRELYSAFLKIDEYENNLLAEEELVLLSRLSQYHHNSHDGQTNDDGYNLRSTDISPDHYRPAKSSAKISRKSQEIPYSPIATTPHPDQYGAHDEDEDDGSLNNVSGDEMDQVELLPQIYPSQALALSKLNVSHASTPSHAHIHDLNLILTATGSNFHPFTRTLSHRGSDTTGSVIISHDKGSLPSTGHTGRSFIVPNDLSTNASVTNRTLGDVHDAQSVVSFSPSCETMRKADGQDYIFTDTELFDLGMAEFFAEDLPTKEHALTLLNHLEQQFSLKVAQNSHIITSALDYQYILPPYYLQLPSNFTHEIKRAEPLIIKDPIHYTETHIFPKQLYQQLQHVCFKREYELSQTRVDVLWDAIQVYFPEYTASFVTEIITNPHETLFSPLNITVLPLVQKLINSRVIHPHSVINMKPRNPFQLIRPQRDKKPQNYRPKVQSCHKVNPDSSLLTFRKDISSHYDDDLRDDDDEQHHFDNLDLKKRQNFNLKTSKNTISNQLEEPSELLHLREQTLIPLLEFPQSISISDNERDHTPLITPRRRHKSSLKELENPNINDNYVFSDYFYTPARMTTYRHSETGLTFHTTGTVTRLEVLNNRFRDPQSQPQLQKSQSSNCLSLPPITVKCLRDDELVVNSLEDRQYNNLPFASTSLFHALSQLALQSPNLGYIQSILFILTEFLGAPSTYTSIPTFIGILTSLQTLMSAPHTAYYAAKHCFIYDYLDCMFEFITSVKSMTPALARFSFGSVSSENVKTAIKYIPQYQHILSNNAVNQRAIQRAVANKLEHTLTHFNQNSASVETPLNFYMCADSERELVELIALLVQNNYPQTPSPQTKPSSTNAYLDELYRRQTTTGFIPLNDFPIYQGNQSDQASQQIKRTRLLQHEDVKFKQFVYFQVDAECEPLLPLLETNYPSSSPFSPLKDCEGAYDDFLLQNTPNDDGSHVQKVQLLLSVHQLSQDYLCQHKVLRNVTQPITADPSSPNPRSPVISRIVPPTIPALSQSSVSSRGSTISSDSSTHAGSSPLADVSLPISSPTITPTRALKQRQTFNPLMQSRHMSTLIELLSQHLPTNLVVRRLQNYTSVLPEYWFSRYYPSLGFKQAVDKSEIYSNFVQAFASLFGLPLPNVPCDYNEWLTEKHAFQAIAANFNHNTPSNATIPQSPQSLPQVNCSEIIRTNSTPTPISSSQPQPHYNGHRFPVEVSLAAQKSQTTPWTSPFHDLLHLPLIAPMPIDLDNISPRHSDTSHLLHSTKESNSDGEKVSTSLFFPSQLDHLLEPDYSRTSHPSNFSIQHVIGQQTRKIIPLDCIHVAVNNDTTHSLVESAMSQLSYLPPSQFQYYKLIAEQNYHRFPHHVQAQHQYFPHFGLPYSTITIPRHKPAKQRQSLALLCSLSSSALKSNREPACAPASFNSHGTQHFINCPPRQTTAHMLPFLYFLPDAGYFCASNNHLPQITSWPSVTLDYPPKKPRPFVPASISPHIANNCRKSPLQSLFSPNNDPSSSQIVATPGLYQSHVQIHHRESSLADNLWVLHQHTFPLSFKRVPMFDFFTYCLETLNPDTAFVTLRMVLLYLPHNMQSYLIKLPFSILLRYVYRIKEFCLLNFDPGDTSVSIRFVPEVELLILLYFVQLSTWCSDTPLLNNPFCSSQSTKSRFNYCDFLRAVFVIFQYNWQDSSFLYHFVLKLMLQTTKLYDLKTQFNYSRYFTARSQEQYRLFLDYGAAKLSLERSYHQIIRTPSEGSYQLHPYSALDDHATFVKRCFERRMAEAAKIYHDQSAALAKRYARFNFPPVTDTGALAPGYPPPTNHLSLPRNTYPPDCAYEPLPDHRPPFTIQMDVERNKRLLEVLGDSSSLKNMFNPFYPCQPMIMQDSIDERVKVDDATAVALESFIEMLVNLTYDEL